MGLVIIGVTDEAQDVHSQTTISLYTNDYWFEVQTTISFRMRITIRLYPKQLLNQTQTTTAPLHLLTKHDLYAFT